MKDRIKVTSEIFIEEPKIFSIPLNELHNHIDAFKKVSPYDMDGIVTIRAGKQEATMGHYMGFLWQLILNALEELLSDDIATFSCYEEVTVKHLKNSQKDILSWEVACCGGKVEYDFKPFVFELLDAAEEFFTSVTNNLGNITLDIDVDNSYDYSSSIEYLKQIREKYLEIYR